MKVFLILGAIALLLWLLRRDLSPRRSPKPRQAAPGAQPMMVRCEQCGLHLPRDEALPGPGGAHYCCVEHQNAHR